MTYIAWTTPQHECDTTIYLTQQIVKIYTLNRNDMAKYGTHNSNDMARNIVFEYHIFIIGASMLPRA